MMEKDYFSITKRDGKEEKFSLDKIMNAIIKAFHSVNEPIDLGRLSQVLGNLDIKEGIKVEDIQNQVETSLMAERYFSADAVKMGFLPDNSEIIHSMRICSLIWSKVVSRWVKSSICNANLCC